MNSVPRVGLTLLLLILGGCATPAPPGAAAAARMVVEEYIHNGDAKTAGPLTGKNSVDDFDRLSDADRQEASSLLEQGAMGFSIFIPDFANIMHTASGPVPDMIKLDRVVFVRGGKVVGDFKAR